MSTAASEKQIHIALTEFEIMLCISALQSGASELVTAQAADDSDRFVSNLRTGAIAAMGSLESKLRSVVGRT